MWVARAQSSSRKNVCLSRVELESIKRQVLKESATSGERKDKGKNTNSENIAVELKDGNEHEAEIID